ncbi:DNA (cytosine-5-)-methyltransferase [Sphingomonas sp. LB-2]|uniref:DNA (cytosine-5-)-methyltransferase n=1 Tax=Sphingomonas caeni TaxID=2984949 RepID=UPI00222F593E|nr:DNA (cytosine-5-)-methyltransferase [Sphingomonas caeni]MCW3846438.1 DNA (cytosine-5-)-methyltransferase [Sphingomonas caeni]
MNEQTEFAILRRRAALSIQEAAQLLHVCDRTVKRYETPGEKGFEPSAGNMDLIRRMAEANRSKVPAIEKSFRFIDLFAGIGGMRKPFEEIGGQCIFTAEWDRFARETYTANFHDDPFTHEFAHDIRPYAEDPDRVPEHDVLVAGFPCQPFSIAGVSKKNALGRPHGFLCDTQGTLFYDLAKIIAHRRPQAFLLENVKNLERHDGGKTFATILHALREELEYDVHFKVISSAPWVPQKRERIFIVGFREPQPFSFDQIEMPEGRAPVLGDILEKKVSDKYTLTDHLWKYLKGYKAKHALAGNGFGYSVFDVGDVTRTLSARYYKDGSECLVAQAGKAPRRLTPRECARLMGFDGPQESKFKITVSDTQAYRQFGNAVAVPVVRAVAKAMAPYVSASGENAQAPGQRNRELMYG